MQQALIDFRSDNTGRAAPELIAALAAANTGTALGYGMDPLTAQLQTRFAELFETPVRVFPVPTGTAANALSLASVCTPFGAVYCSADAHINTSECNATGFFSGGAKLVTLAGQRRQDRRRGARSGDRQRGGGPVSQEPARGRQPGPGDRPGRRLQPR